ncbi:MAG: hypothetical protein ACSLEY_03835, partial [Candidatus Saccharimonadales bacterium]
TYFIGGAPRSGKSTVMNALIERRPMLAASTDAIRSVAKGMTTPEANPRLFKTLRGDFGSDQHIALLTNNPNEAMEYELGEADETWKSVLDFLSYYQQDDKDVVIEGVAVLPHQLEKVNFDYKAVFIANLSDQADTILEYAAAHPSDWLHKYDEQTVRLYAKFNQQWNMYYAEEAQKLHMPVVVIDNDDFESGIQKSINILLA